MQPYVLAGPTSVRRSADQLADGQPSDDQRSGMMPSFAVPLAAAS